LKVLLTGGGGMVGRNVLDHPLARGFDIHAPSRAQVDLRDKASVRRYVADLKPDIVVHAAGKVGGIQANIAEPYAFLLENLEIGSNVVAAAADCGVDRLLNLASSCVYPKNVDGFLHEEMILTGELEPTNEGYALAKLATLKLCQYASAGATGRQFKTIVPCNLYGRWDNFDLDSGHLIPAVIHKVHRAKVERLPTVEIWGDGQARREFMYAGDLADAVMEAMVRFESTPPLMNIGLGHDYTVLEYYQAVADVIGWRGEFTFNLAKPAGMRRKLVDVSRQKAWGWQPATSLADGLAATYDFFTRERQ
jgi:GDP-L-fucose synthase